MLGASGAHCLQVGFSAALAVLIWPPIRSLKKGQRYSIISPLCLFIMSVDFYTFVLISVNWKTILFLLVFLFSVPMWYSSQNIFSLLRCFWLPPDTRPFDLQAASSLCLILLVCLLAFQILFMNKIDLFQDKILHSGRHLRLYLPQFKGSSQFAHTHTHTHRLFFFFSLSISRPVSCLGGLRGGCVLSALMQMSI